MVVSSSKLQSPIYTTKSFLYASMSANQSSNLTADNHVEFDTNEAGNLVLSSGSGQENGIVTLPAGKRYLLQAKLLCTLNSSSDYVFFRFYDRTNSESFGSQSLMYPATTSSNVAVTTLVTGVIEPLTEDVDIELRISIGSGSITSITGYTASMIIESVEGYNNISLESWDYAVFTNAENTFTQDQTFSGEVTFSDNANFSFPSITISTGTATADWTDANKQKITLDQNTSISFTDPSGACNLLLMVVQDATGSRILTFPSGIKWSGGTAPTLTTDANAIDIISFFFDGSTYYGMFNTDFKTS